MRIRRVKPECHSSLRRLLIVAVVPALVAAGLMLSAIATPTRPQTAGILNMSGETIDGEAVSMAGFRGRVVVVNVWASWCAECIAEAPALRAVWETEPAVAFVGINVQDTRAEAIAFRDEYRLSYPSLFDPPGEFRRALQATIPSTFVIDSSSRIAFRRLGPVTEATLRAAIDRARERNVRPQK